MGDPKGILYIRMLAKTPSLATRTSSNFRAKTSLVDPWIPAFAVADVDLGRGLVARESGFLLHTCTRGVDPTE